MTYLIRKRQIAQTRTCDQTYSTSIEPLKSHHSNHHNAAFTVCITKIRQVFATRMDHMVTQRRRSRSDMMVVACGWVWYHLAACFCNLSTLLSHLTSASAQASHSPAILKEFPVHRHVAIDILERPKVENAQKHNKSPLPSDFLGQKQRERKKSLN